MDLRIDAEHGLERGDEALFALRDLGQRIGEVVGRHLDEHVERVGVVDAVDHNLIVGRVALLQQDGLDLRREDVDALDDQHVVAAASRLAHLDVRAPAGAFFAAQHADIARAVAQQREGLLCDGREDQLALHALRQDLTGVGIDDLGDKMVLIDVHAGLRAAFIGHTRAGQLREAVDIIDLDAEALLDILPHLLAPCFRAENTGLQMDPVLQTALVDGFCQIGGVGRCAAEDRRAEILHELQLPVGVAGGHRERQAAELLAAAVEAEAAGEQAVAISHLAHVLFRAAGGGDGSCAAVLPEVNVLFGVERDNALAGRAGGGVDADTVLQRHCKQAVGICVAQVGFAEERELVKIVPAFDIVGREARRFHFRAVIGDIVPDVAHLPDEPLILPAFDLLGAGAFDFFLIIVFHGRSLCFVAEGKGLFVEFEESGRDALFNRVLPLLVRKVEIPAEPSEENQIDRLGRACLQCQPQRVHGIQPDGERRELLLQRPGVLRRAGDDRHGVDSLRIRQQNAALFEVFRPAGGLQQFKAHDDVRFALVDDRGIDLVAAAHIGDDAAAALAHAVHLADLDVIAVFQQNAAQQLAGQQRALTADADNHDVFRFHDHTSLRFAQRAFFAQLAAQAAARAEGVVDLDLPAHHADGGTAELHAGLAAHALFGASLDGAGVLDIFEQRARAAGDDDRRLARGQLLLDGLVARGKIIRVDDAHAADADRVTQRFQIDLRAGVALEVEAGRRVLLVAGHTGDGVIENDDGRSRLVVGDVDETRDAGMHERRIADDGDGVVGVLLAGGLVEAVQAGDGRAHTDGRVDRLQRRGRAQRVAADVAEDGQLVLFERVEQTSVRTARAHDGRTRRDRLIEGVTGMDSHAELFGNIILAELADAAEQLLARDILDADGAAVRLNDPVQLLHDDDLLHALCKRAELFDRQRMDHAELQNGVSAAADLLDVLVARRGCDKTNGVVGAVLHAVHVRRLCPRLQRERALLDDGVPRPGAGGHHNEFGDVLLIGDGRVFLPVGGLNDALRMRHAGTHLEKHGGIELLGKLVAELRERQRLRRVGRFEHRQLRRDGIVAGILLVLGRVHPRVVRHADEKSAAHAGVGQRKQRVGRDVQTDVLHAAEAAVSGEACAEGRFHGDLFVGRPFRVNFGIFGRTFRDFRAGRAGVAGDKAAARFKQAAGGGFVAEHQSFHGGSLLSAAGPREKIIFIVFFLTRFVKIQARVCSSTSLPPQ